MKIKPKYPIYVVSKGRSESRLTAKSLEEMNVDYFMVIEQHDYDDYARVIDPAKILILPFSNHGEGPGPARNFCWEHSMTLGAKRHWVMDDNLISFYRMNHNKRVKCTSGTIFRASEDFVDRYENVAISGLQYRFFCAPDSYLPPYVKNTRIYSCLLIENDTPFRWRGRYNEDTDICLRVLKAGLCTIQFNAFLQGKSNTGIMKGGNTAEFYSPENSRDDIELDGEMIQDVGGTVNKSQMLYDMHPDVTTVVWRYKRWHHHVNYEPFKKNELIRVADYDVPKVINNYGMEFVDLREKKHD